MQAVEPVPPPAAKLGPTSASSASPPVAVSLLEAPDRVSRVAGRIGQDGLVGLRSVADHLGK